MLIPPENEVPGMTPADKQLLNQLNEQIQSLNEDHDRLESTRSRLEQTDAADFTPADVAAAEGMRSAQVALQRREIEVRTLLDKWLAARSRAYRRAADKAAAARDALVTDLVKKMLALGFAEEVPVPGLGVTVPGILDQQLARHPKLAEAIADVTALQNQSGSFDADENHRQIERLTRSFDRIKGRALATL